jgi:hypothetical protein
MTLLSSGCELFKGDEDQPFARLTVKSRSTTDIVDVNIRIVDRVEGGMIYFRGENYGDEISYIPTGSSETVGLEEAATYYIYIESADSGNWFDTADIKEGDHWTVTYDYNGGHFSH